MAQARKRRRRKHRGTQTGRVDTRARGGRPRSRQEARARAKRQAGDRRDIPPTWRGAINRALIAAAIFLAVLVLLMGQSFGSAFALAAFMVLLYIPLGYAIERFFYNRRQAMKRRARDAARK